MNSLRHQPFKLKKFWLLVLSLVISPQFLFAAEDCQTLLEMENAASKNFHVSGIISGYIIYRGRVLEAPYDVEWDGKDLKINENITDLIDRERIQKLPDHLDANYLLLLHGGTTHIFESTSEYGMALLRVISDPQNSNENLDFAMEKLDHIEEKEIIRQGLLKLEVSPATRHRAAENLQQIAEVEAMNDLQNQAVSRMNAYSYPLTMIGMVLTVIAFGHLLSYRPDQYEADKSMLSHSEALKMMMRSLMYVLLLSSLDLIWTVLASQAGQMRELNPLANQMINDPNQLMTFKAVTTLLGTAILFFLKNSPISQKASWWICLICTILSFRWLTFNAMMIG